MKDLISQHSLPPSEYIRILSEEEEPATLRDYWIIICRYRRAAVLFFLALLFVAVIAIPWDRLSYTAMTTLYIPSQYRGALENSVQGTHPTYEIVTQRQLLTSRSLAAEVIKSLDLAHKPDFTQKPESLMRHGYNALKNKFQTTRDLLEGTQIGRTIFQYLGLTSETSRFVKFELGVHPGLIDRYLSWLEVSALPESSLITVKFTSPNPELSQAVANAHIATFITKNLATRFELTSETRQYLERKLAELKVNVEKSEKALNTFQKNHEVVSLDKGQSLLLDQLRKLNADLTEARSKRIELESLNRLIQKRDIQLLSRIIDNPTVAGLRKQITDLEATDARLATKFKLSYRGRQAVAQELAQARGRLDEEINRVVATIRKDYVAAAAQEHALSSEVDKTRRLALNLQEKAVEYAVLEREVVSNRALYEAVFKKTKEAALTGDDPVPSLRIIDRAEIPVVSELPSWVINLLLAILIGSFGGIGLTFLCHLLDNKLRTPEEVARFLHLPLLGFVPDVHKLMQSGTDTEPDFVTIPPALGPMLPLCVTKTPDTSTILHSPLSLMAELYRSICMGMMFSKADTSPRTVLVTSAQANEGKTVTAINLAITLAQSGENTLLIDADLHAGGCHRLLGFSSGIGLSNVLTGTDGAISSIRKTKIKNLSLLSRGTFSPNPAALLGSNTMQHIVKGLTEQFRFIILDTPPLIPISDAVLVAQMVDGVILVVKAQEVPRDIVRKARDRLKSVHADILGVVLNGVDLESVEYAPYRKLYDSHYARYDKNSEFDSSSEVLDCGPRLSS